MAYTALSGWSDPAEAAEAPATPAKFRAGAATSNITPRLGISINGHFNDRKAANIHDELHVRCLVLDNNETRVAFAVCDSCMIPREVMDRAKEMIRQKTGISPDRVLVSATHTHTAAACTGVFQTDADPQYAAFLAERIADGVARAAANAAPAKIAWGKGREPNQVFNRRWKMKPGSIGPNPLGGTNDTVRMNPPVESPDLLEPAGPTDPEVSIVAVQSLEGRPIGLLAAYSLHYVGTGRDSEISADYYGVFAERIRDLLGAERLDPPFVAMMANGTSGDINNINFRKKQGPQPPYGQMRAVAEAVATETHRVCQGFEYKDSVPLKVRQTELKLGVRRPTDAEVKRAEEILAKANPKNLRTAEEVYARETMLMEEYPAEVPVVLQVIRIGDLAIAAVPCEVFAEIGLEIKKRSPFPQTFTIELANGYNGYLPTPAQHRLGGYETWRARSSYLEVNAAPKIVDTLLQLMTSLR